MKVNFKSWFASLPQVQGMLACGYEGLGRLWPVEKIVERVLQLLA